MKITIHYSFLFSLCSNILYYVVAFPILKVVTKIVYDLKIEGKENIRNRQESVVSVSNHVLVLDCAMIGLAYGKKKVFYTAQEESFEIPFVKHLIKLLRAIPVPKKIQDKKQFIHAVDELLYENQSVHFYPEAELISYDTNIRMFKNGAFDFAIRNNVAIVPMVFCFREPKGIRKLLKRKKDVTLKVLEPIENKEYEMDIKERIQSLKKETYEKMRDAIIKEEENVKKNKIQIS